jgi:hypothetical protein
VRTLDEQDNELRAKLIADRLRHWKSITSALRSAEWADAGVGIIAASHALAGRTDEARRAMHHLLRLDPALRISNLKD